MCNQHCWTAQIVCPLTEVYSPVFLLKAEWMDIDIVGKLIKVAPHSPCKYKVKYDTNTGSTNEWMHIDIAGKLIKVG